MLESLWPRNFIVPHFPLILPSTSAFISSTRRNVDVAKKKYYMTLPTQEVGDTFLRTYGHTSIMVKGHKVMFRLSDKPVNEGRVRHVRSTPWEDPNALEERNKQNQSSRVDNGWIFVPRIACHDNSRMVRCLLCSLFSCKRVLSIIGINKICPSKICAQSVRGISNGITNFLTRFPLVSLDRKDLIAAAVNSDMHHGGRTLRHIQEGYKSKLKELSCWTNVKFPNPSLRTQ
jgi:hypothetical protein